MGTSLGGYWTNNFAAAYGISAVIINPAIDPKHTLVKYIGESVAEVIWTPPDADAYTDFTPESAVQRIVLLAKDDDVIAYLPTLNLLERHATIRVFESGGHTFSDEASLNAIRKVVQEAFERIAQYGMMYNCIRSVYKLAMINSGA